MGFVEVGQPPDMVAEPGRVVVDDETAVHVGCGVVPGWYDASVFGLRYQEGEM
jgi:hypothetical protein